LAAERRRSFSDRVCLSASRLLGGLAAAAALRASVGEVDAALLLLPGSGGSAPDPDRVRALVGDAAWWLLGSLVCLGVAGAALLVCRRPYLRPRPVGVALALVAATCWYLSAAALVAAGEALTLDTLPALVLCVVCGLLVFPLLRAGSVLIARARQHMAVPPDELLRRDGRAPVVYLRSFGTDLEMAPGSNALEVRRSRALSWGVLDPDFWTAQREWTFEEVLCRALGELGPVIALGRPGEPLPLLGAARKYVADRDWQSEVLDMVRTARLVCLVVGSSEGLSWEFDQLVAQKLEAKVLLAIPPSNASAAWRGFARAVARRGTGPPLPPELPDTPLAMLFADRQTPVLVAGEPTPANYRALVRRFETVPEGQSPAIPGAPRPARVESPGRSDSSGETAHPHATSGQLVRISDAKSGLYVSLRSSLVVLPMVALARHIGTDLSGQAWAWAGAAVGFAIACYTEIGLIAAGMGMSRRLLMLCLGVEPAGKARLTADRVLGTYRRLRKPLTAQGFGWYAERIAADLITGINAASQVAGMPDVMKAADALAERFEESEGLLAGNAPRGDLHSGLFALQRQALDFRRSAVGLALTMQLPLRRL
jgi:hypothetical protein